MKKYFLIFLFLYTCISGFSQVYTPEWGKVWTGPLTNSYRGSPINMIKNYIIDNNSNQVFVSELVGLYDYDPGPATYTLLTSPDGPGGSNSGMVIYKLDSLGNFLWAKKIFNPAISCWPVNSATDSHSNIYVTLDGWAGTIDVDPGPGVANMTLSTNYLLLIKYDKNGNYVWAKKIPNSTYAFFRIDKNDVICAYDRANGTVDVDPGPATYTVSVLSDYIAKYDTNGLFIGIKNFGANSFPSIVDMTFDQSNNPVFLGTYTSTTDFDSGPATQTLSVMSGMNNFCVFKTTPAYDIVWENAFHMTNQSSFIERLFCNASGEVSIGGSVFSGTLYPVYNNSSYAFNSTNGRGFFAIKYDMNGTYIKEMYVPNIFLSDVYFGQDGSFYTCGYLAGYTSDFDPGAGTYNLAGHALGDSYFSIYDSDFQLKNVQLYNNTGAEDFQTIQFIRENNNRIFCYLQQSGNVNYGIPGASFPISGTVTALLKFYKTCGFAVIGGVTPICSGTSSTLTATGGTNYIWQPGGIASPSVVVSPTVTTTYSVSGTNTCGVISNTFVLAVAYNPTITLAASNSSVCLGKNTVISGQVTGTPPMYIKWNGGSWAAYTNGTPFSYTVTPGASTVYTMTTQDKCATLSETVAIQAMALPSLSVSGTTSLCAGASASLTALGADTYSWSTGANTSGVNFTPPLGSSIYSVTGVDLTTNCSRTQTVNVSVYTNTVNVTVAGNNAICTGQTTTLTASGAASYSWSTGDGTSSIIVSPISSEVYTVTGTDLLNCSNTRTVSVTTNALPVITAASGTVCIGESFVINPSGAVTYTYSAGTPTVSPLSTDSYTISGTDVNNCIGTQTVSVVVNMLPTITANGGHVCQGETFTITPTGAISYTYSGGSDVVSPLTTSVYTVSGSDLNNCIGTKTLTVTVNPLPVISINSGAICAGDNFTLVPTGAISYSFSGGSDVVSPASDATYTITGADVNNCMGYALSTVTVNALPNLTLVSAGSVCEGSSANISATGATTYTWSTGANTNSITVTPVASTVYSVTGTDLNNCSATQTVSVIVNNTCQDVWPGDANSDGVADNLDVLELGLHYTQTGPARATVSNNWQSYYATNWTGTITNGKNVNHSDCNGDGTINDDDTLAIFNNYGLTHAFKSPAQTTTNPQLSIVPDQAMVVTGNWGSSSVYLGQTTDPVNNINGVAFTVGFDNTLIETNSIYIEYHNSFIDAGQNLKFRKLNFSNGELYTATTHTISNNVSGDGKIATLHYKIIPGLTTDEVLNLSITQANMSNASGVITPLTSGTGTVMTIGASVGLKDSENTLVSIVPNPASDYITIRSTQDMEKVEITNVAGQVLKAEQIKNQTTTINIQDLANGVYFVKVYHVNGSNYIIKKVVVNR